jgi:hypothetical protein
MTRSASNEDAEHVGLPDPSSTVTPFAYALIGFGDQRDATGVHSDLLFPVLRGGPPAVP